MKFRKLEFILCFLTVMFATTAQAQTTSFSYQGHLNNGAVPANGNYEMEFKVFDAIAGGAQIGDTLTDASVSVINGTFSTTLDFGAPPFDTGGVRYLEIAVRPLGNPNPFTILSPRQQIKSAPFAIQARNAATADNATNALQLGGIDASEYVTTASVGNSFIKNATTLQPTSNFNISGNGMIGGDLGIGVVPQNGVRLDLLGNATFRTANGNINFGSPNGETGITYTGTNRADLRFDGTTLRFFAGTGLAPPGNGLIINTLGNVATSGNLGVGTFSPDTRLTLNGGPQWTSAGWTASMNLRNASAIAWDANASGQRWGIGQTAGGLYFFRSFSSFGTTSSPAEYAMTLTDTGNIAQPRDKSGLVKAMLYVNANATIARCYNGITNSSTGTCGFTTSYNGLDYAINFGFQVNDRFISITPQSASSVNIGTSFFFPASPQQILIRTFITDVDQSTAYTPNPFMIVVY